MISIIIATYNRADMLRRCLKALAPQVSAVKGCEIIIVDDGSSDNTYDVAKGFHVRYFRQKNKGPAAARNLGVKHAKGDIIAFIDDDCIARKDWIKNILNDFGKLEDADCVGYFAVSVFDNRLMKGLTGFHKSNALEKFPVPKRLELIPEHTLYTSNCALKKSIFRKIRFDERFDYAGEDRDFFYRLIRSGHAVYVCNNLIVYHHQRSKLTDIMKRHYLFGISDAINFEEHFRKKLYIRSTISKDIFLKSPFALRISINIFKAVFALLILGIFAKIFIYAAILALLLSFFIRLYQYKGVVKVMESALLDIITMPSEFAGNVVGSFRYKVIVL